MKQNMLFHTYVVTYKFNESKHFVTDHINKYIKTTKPNIDNPKVKTVYFTDH